LYSPEVAQPPPSSRGNIKPVEKSFVILGFYLFAAKENNHELLVGFASESTLEK
jgi:hypothetical protein